MNEYHYALESLQKLVEMWEKAFLGKHVAVKIIDADQNAHIPPCQSQPPVTIDMPSTTSNIPLDAEHHGHTLQLPPLHSQPPVTSDMPPTTSHTPLTHLSPNQSQPSTKSKPLSDFNYEEGVLSTKIQLTPKMIKRGRPKASDLTVIGLPAKKHRQKETLPTPFIKKSPEKKKKYIVSWIIPTYFGESLLGKKFAVKDLPERANQLSPKLHDVNVELQRVKKYFESSAWDVLGVLIAEKEQFPNWPCSTCEEDLHEFESIQCDSCLNWHHLKCVCRKTAPKQKWWYCSRCYEICGC